MVIDGTTRDPSHAYNPLIGSILPRAAGTGIAELISQAMAEAGMDIHEARRRNALFDKEEALDDCRAAFPAEHYVLVDDKPRILAAVKRFWGGRVTTVFARRGSYARDPQSVGALPPADVMIERIGDLLSFDLPRLRPTRDRLLRPDRAAGGLGNRRRPHDDGEARG